MKPTAIYSRKSKFTGKGESTANQIDLCREYIALHSGKEAARTALIFEDEGFSGGNLNRPAFQQMLSAARNHEISSIVVYRLDRISRNISDFSTLIEELSRLNVAFISIREQFDTGSPMGRAMMYIASVFSQLERETIAERIRDNMHELAKTGRWLGGNTPTGYCSESVQTITVDGKSRKSCKLKLLPEEGELVRKIYSLYAQTDSLSKTEAELRRQNIKTKTGRDFTRFAVRNILQNPVYLLADQEAYQYFTENEAELCSSPADFDSTHGILAYNRTDQEKGRATVYLPVNEWIVTVGQHEGLIPGREWVKVQESLEQNRSKSYRKPRSNQALLTGLLFCSCGSRMYPKVSKRLNKEGQLVYSYVCKCKEHSQGSQCAQKNVSGNRLDAAVLEEIKGLTEDKAAFVEQLEKSKSFYSGDRTGYDERLAGLRKKCADVETKLTALVDSLAELDSTAAKNQVAKRIDELSGQQETLQTRITELEGLTAQNELSAEEFDILVQMLSSFRTTIDLLSVEEKRAAIRTVVQKVVWDGDAAHVVLFGAEGDVGYTTIPDLSQSSEDSK
ncbi:recombinase family protein [Acutalibacter muris]|uniref:Recombinase family protein n=1 Tax=Acutalibacter muris TaxID=1796620 RepID=A0A1Z2XUI8_9FIRM|nr:recombinase family protein [Acutalibacter muris]ANU54651.1 resolvase [Hungateiclostridiaceae bacterium KB18]ASB42118.1 resolvase [Acutalibacter muris]QQR31388.1 recombinase family protein [Acutalibacter muris]